MINNRLPSGSFLPSGLLDLDTDEQTAFNSTFNNMSLKMGLVKEAYEIDDENNISKIAVEYDVLVNEQREQTAPTPITYKNCIHKDAFGGLADFFEFRLRKQDKVEKREKDGDKIGRLQDGSIVLLLCLNGFNENAIILGGAQHPKRKSKLTKDAGHAMFGEFNGLGLTIDKDGALTLSFKGATDHAGEPLDAAVGGSYITIKKDGSIEINDGKKERVLFDKTAEKTELEAGKDMSITSGKKLDVTVGDTATFKVAKDLFAEATGSCSLKMKDLKVESQGPANVKASALDVQIDGIVKLKGSQITLDGMTFVGGAGGSPALILSTMFLGTGNMGAPVISQAIGPFSSKVFISS